MRLSSSLAACSMSLALVAAACADRGEMSTDRNDTNAQYGTDTANRTPITVTGCFQEASGFNNYVLTNINEGSPEQRARGYRIERGGDIEEHVGKQVKVTGWIEPSDMASAQPDQTSRQTSGTTGKTSTDFGDLPELHVDAIERVSETCGNTAGSKNQ